MAPSIGEKAGKVADVGVNFMTLASMLSQAYSQRAVLSLLFAIVGLHLYLCMEVSCVDTPFQEPAITIPKADFVSMWYMSDGEKTPVTLGTYDTNVYVPPYHDLQVTACIRAAPGGRDLLHGVMILLLTLSGLSGVMAVLNSIMKVVVWDMFAIACTAFTVLSQALLMTLLTSAYIFITHMHHEDNTARDLIHGASMAEAIGVIGAVGATVFALSYCITVVASWSDQKKATKERFGVHAANFSAALMRMVGTATGRNDVEADLIAGKTIGLQQVRLNSLIYMFFCITVSIMGFFSHSVSVGTGHGVAVSRDNVYIHGVSTDFFRNTTVRIGSPFVAGVETEFHLVYNGTISTAYAIKHHHTEYGKAALGTFITAAIIILLDAILVVWQMTQAETKPDKAHTDSFLIQQSATLMSTFPTFMMGYLIALLPPMALLDIIYIYQQVI